MLARRHAPLGVLVALATAPRWQAGIACAAATQQHVCHVRHVPGVHTARADAQVMIMAHDRERGRLAFSTKKLEPAPGDMLRDPAKVFASAEDMAELFKVCALASLSPP